MLRIRPDILKAHASLFGVKTANGRSLHVERTIEVLASEFAADFATARAARARFLRDVAAGTARYAFPELDAEHRDVDGTVRTTREIALGLRANLLLALDRGAELTDAERACVWRLNDKAPLPPQLLRPGLQGTGPADDMGMLFSALHASDYGAVSWMWDWEDAGNDVRDKLYRAFENLRDVLDGVWGDGLSPRTYLHPTKRNPNGTPRAYAIRSRRADWVSAFCRVPGIHLDSRQIQRDGAPVPATLAALVIHTLNVFSPLAQRDLPVCFYVPKIETPEEALLVAHILVALETALGVLRGSLKIEVLNERARHAAFHPVILWTLRDWLVGANVGRWDYLSSIIEMCKDQRDAQGHPIVLPDPHTVTMTAPFLVAYTRRNALLTLLASLDGRGEPTQGMPIGGMAAVMKLPLRDVRPSDPEEQRRETQAYNARATEINRRALNAMWFDKLRERLTGLLEIEGRAFDTYRQSWVATTDREYVEAGAEPLQAPVDALQKLVDRTEHASGWALTADQRRTLVELGLLDGEGRIRRHRVALADLAPEALFGTRAWADLFEMPRVDGSTRRRTLTGMKYALHMASEYGFQQLNGNNAAAIADPLNGTRLMNDFATYEIFWHWLKTMLDARIRLDEGGSLQTRTAEGSIESMQITAGSSVTPELLDQLLVDRQIEVDAYFASHPDPAQKPARDLGLDVAGYLRKFPDSDHFDRRLAPVVLAILRRQILHPRWVMYGARVLLCVIERDAAERDLLLDAIFAPSREHVQRQVDSGAWPAEALRMHDFVFDTAPLPGAR
jgi:malate synthase